MTEKAKFWIAGKHTVLEALKNKKNKIYKILIQNKENIKYFNSSLIKLIKISNSKEISSILNNADINHQGFVAQISRSESNINKSDIFNEENILILDGINDQRNIGSIIRTAYAFNIKIIIVNKAEYNEKSILLNKTASGIIEKIKIFKVSNVLNIIKELKKKNFWVYCFDSNTNNFFSKNLLSKKNVFIFGSENTGARKIIRDNSDHVVKIKINKEVDSLNVSACVASALTIVNHA